MESKSIEKWAEFPESICKTYKTIDKYQNGRLI